MNRLLLVVSGALLLLLLGGSSPAAAGRGVIAESPGCGYPRFYLPDTGRSGSLPDSFPVRGPAGALFGRTLEDVRERLAWWTVPMSGGVRVQVHERLLPVLAEVEENLAEAALSGVEYLAREGQTWGFNPRTSVSHEAISYHGLGAAIDINSATNPYRRDGRLVTDMPRWYVEAWESAGMCWGGNWLGVKDPMHFSWTGPGPSPAYDAIPAPIPPRTSPASFTDAAGAHPVVFGSTDHPRFVVDASGDGAPDVAHLRPWGEHAVLELATSQRGYAACSVWRWWLEDPPGGDPVLADTTGTGRPDLLFVDGSGDNLILRRYAVGDGYDPAPDIPTAVPSDARRVFGDVDRDGADDLWALTQTAEGVGVRIWSAASSYTEIIQEGVVDLPLSDSTRLATADRDVDGRADLMVIEPAGGGATVRVVSSADLSAVAEVLDGPPIGSEDRIGFDDYDGDGRPDLQVLAGGTLQAWVGNSPLGEPDPSSWFLPADFDCPEGTLPYHHEGAFADDEESVYQSDIEWLAATGVTRGCNPPFEDRFCPQAVVTRGQMAAFLVRALRLPAAASGFADVDGSVFEDDIGSLAAAGVTRGCNPPDNDRFCPESPVTRGQMAAFLVRALGLPAAGNPFGDDDGSVFEGDIGALAAAGITRGCNPPDNDRFCPEVAVTRGQMAAFLHRAGGLFEIGDGRS